MRTAALAIFVTLAASAAVVDRVAVVVGDTVLTESEVLQEVRMEAFLNREALDLGPAQRRAAAERLVDQQLIRNEMRVGNYQQPTAKDADAMLRQFKQENYSDEGRYRAALAKYGLTEEDLKQYLLWQLAALRFTDVRFHSAAADTDGANVQHANRLKAGAQEADRSSVDQQMEAWLKEARGGTRIQFKKEAFQ